MYEMLPVFIIIGFFLLLAVVSHMRGRKWDALDKRLTTWRETHNDYCDMGEALGVVMCKDLDSIVDDFNVIAPRRDLVPVGE